MASAFEMLEIGDRSQLGEIGWNKELGMVFSLYANHSEGFLLEDNEEHFLRLSKWW